MALQKATVIGHYKVIKPLGAGGMGEVFLAEDMRLGRKVALKILSEKFLTNGDHLNRFMQEAKTASALNHPNIITVYDIGESGGRHFIATEYIDGETLRERMSKRLTFDETLSVLIQTAEALSAAHTAGIIHRDIKPENVMVRADGYVKVLDFGLAKLTEQHKSQTDAEDATWKLVQTNPGVVMGTVAYMSPEQARGKATDARSDIFSFGAMMYEILAGQPPFAGETVMDVVQAVINSEPQPLSTLAPHLPKELIRIVNKTLKKKSEQRYHLTTDLLNDLKELRAEIQHIATLEKTAVLGKAESREASFSGAKISTNTSGSRLKDALLLTDFENTTGDAIFDHTLKTALTFSLGQSPFLDIVPDAKVANTFKLMKRPANEKVTRETAEELCLRLNLKAFLVGSISNLGSIYFLTLEAIKARTGESLGRELEQANSKEEVLAALSRAATGIREKLGESLGSIQQHNVPLEMTTPSFEAFKFVSFAREKEQSGQFLEAIPFYRKALEYDPEVAAIYMSLAIIYANTNQWQLAKENAINAFALKDSTSEEERLKISYFYYSIITGELDQAISTLELLRRTYTSSPSAFVNLSDTYGRTGQFERAVAVSRDGLRLIDVPIAALYLNMVESLRCLGRCEEAKEVIGQAFEKQINSYYSHMILYQIAFIEQNAEQMAKELEWFNGQTEEHLALDLQSGRAAFEGKWRSCQDFSRRAVDLAVRNNAKEVAARYAANQALRIVFWSSGSGLPKGDESQLKTVLKTQTNKALNLERGMEIMPRAALALAVGGQTAEAEALIEELHNEQPKGMILNELWLPTIRAAILLQAGKPKEAVEELEVTERMQRAAEFYPQYLRGLAFLQMNKPKNAVKEFDKILNNQGEAPLSSVYPLAQLGKARAMKNKVEYEKFFELWKDADQDMPALVAAKNESENIGR